MMKLHCMLLLAGALMLYVDLTYSCSCLPSHGQSSFCRASYVVRARVVSAKQKAPGDSDWCFWRYGIEILKVYKKAKKTNKKWVYTPEHDGICFAHLAVGQEYLLAGGTCSNENKKKKRLNIALCDWHQTFSSLTDFQVEGIMKRYKKNCDCKIKICFGCAPPSTTQTTIPASETTTPGISQTTAATLAPNTVKECVLDASDDNAHCYVKYSFCKSVNGNCGWVMTPELANCLN